MFSVRIKHKHTHSRIHIHVAYKLFVSHRDDYCGFTPTFVIFAINVKLKVSPKILSANNLIALD
jgi:hypothetical protein